MFCEMSFPHASMEQFTNGHLKILKVICAKNLQNHYFTFMTLVKKIHIEINFQKLLLLLSNKNSFSSLTGTVRRQF